MLQDDMPSCNVCVEGRVHLVINNISGEAASGIQKNWSSQREKFVSHISNFRLSVQSPDTVVIHIESF